MTALWTWVGGVLLWRRWQLRRVVHAIRRLTRDDRAAVMASIGSDPVRVFLEFELHEHGQPETGGPVERFHVSPVDQREVESLAYVLLATGIAGATALLALDVSSIGRIALWGASGAACVASVWCFSRARWYRQFYEVSAFGIRSLADGAPLRHSAGSTACGSSIVHVSIGSSSYLQIVRSTLLSRIVSLVSIGCLRF